MRHEKAITQQFAFKIIITFEISSNREATIIYIYAFRWKDILRDFDFVIQMINCAILQFFKGDDVFPYKSIIDIYLKRIYITSRDIELFGQTNFYSGKLLFIKAFIAPLLVAYLQRFRLQRV